MADATVTIKLTPTEHRDLIGALDARLAELTTLVRESALGSARARLTEQRQRLAKLREAL